MQTIIKGIKEGKSPLAIISKYIFNNFHGVKTNEGAITASLNDRISLEYFLPLKQCANSYSFMLLGVLYYHNFQPFHLHI